MRVHLVLAGICFASGMLVACNQADEAKQRKEREIQARLEEESRQLDEGKGALEHWTLGSPPPAASAAKDQ
jgi:hypothetical protein